jgi:hypothetical protein
VCGPVAGYIDPAAFLESRRERFSRPCLSIAIPVIANLIARNELTLASASFS